MFSTNTKPLIIWVALFLSIAFCKICYTSMDLLSTLVMLRFEPVNINFLVSFVVDAQYKSCLASPYPDRIVSCIEGAKIAADGWVGAQQPGSGSNARYQAQLDKWKQGQLDGIARKADDAKGMANPSSASTTASSSVLDAEYYSNQSNLEAVNSTIMSFRKGFAYIIEIMMLVHGIVGPIFLGLSLFPGGIKYLTTWAVSFLSLGFCKICYSLISGLSAIAFVYAGPENTDMTVVAVVLGLLSPALAFSIASSSGIGALNGVIGPAQTGGINFGLGYQTPNNNQKTPPK